MARKSKKTQKVETTTQIPQNAEAFVVGEGTVALLSLALAAFVVLDPGQQSLGPKIAAFGGGTLLAGLMILGLAHRKIDSRVVYYFVGFMAASLLLKIVGPNPFLTAPGDNLAIYATLSQYSLSGW